jgi:uroporphyrinogen-III synthase
MKSTPKTLLFLNTLSKEQLNDFTDYSLNVDSTPLIETEALSFDKSLLDTNIPWVFTSQTAVDLIAGLPLSKKIYAIGQKTASKLSNAIIPNISTAKELAKIIIENKEKKVIFICGDKRRDDLPEILKSFYIEVKEVHVYQTINLNKTVNLHAIDGLAFMSPSAVNSLAQNGGFNNLPCFAIGPTTAQALKDKGQQCIISKATTAKSLVETAKNYFK